MDYRTENFDYTIVGYNGSKPVYRADPRPEWDEDTWLMVIMCVVYFVIPAIMWAVL